MEARESWTPCFSCRSLLLSTTILKVAVKHSAHAFNCIRKYHRNKARLINISDTREVQ